MTGNDEPMSSGPRLVDGATALRLAADALEAQPPKLRAQYVATLRLYADEPWRLTADGGVSFGVIKSPASTHPDSEPHPCGHSASKRGCGGCDPGAIEWVRDDGDEYWIELLPPSVGYDLRHHNEDRAHVSGMECHCRPERIEHAPDCQGEWRVDPASDVIDNGPVARPPEGVGKWRPGFPADWAGPGLRVIRADPRLPLHGLLLHLLRRARCHRAHPRRARTSAARDALLRDLQAPPVRRGAAPEHVRLRIRRGVTA